MNAAELRIGNIVTIDNELSWPKLKGVPMCVTGTNDIYGNKEPEFKPSNNGIGLKPLKQPDPNTYSQYEQFVKPVPLTEEWLIKFGFETRKDTGMSPANSWQGMDHWVKGQITFRGSPKFGLSLYGISAYPKRDIKYVHQLQNLYFALTGTELTIQP